jgi:nicotinamidase/pyrazinamidase
VVDVQIDFCPGGSLAVSHGDEVILPLNETIKAFERARLPMFFTRDWHPRNHCSFKSQGGIWPVHCVKGTNGARFHHSLRVPPEARIISKGTGPKTEAYSGFQGTNLASELEQLGVHQLFVGGLATDYCVKNTVLDARARGFQVCLLGDCVKGVNVNKTDSARATKSMLAAGAKSISSKEAARKIRRHVAVLSSS